MRTVTRAPRACTIAAPLLVVTTSLDDGAHAGRLFGLVPSVTVLGVFGHPGPAEPVIDLREAQPIATMSLGRAPGERTKTGAIADLIGDAIVRSGAATVAVGLGLGGGDRQEAADAALLARRRRRSRIGWIVYVDAVADSDAGRVARRRMQLFMRGIRLEPVAVAEAPLGTSARFWQIRAADG